MIFVAVLFLYMQAGFANGQVVSGCPLYGCTPGGSFSLDTVLSSPNVEIAWVTKLENTSSHQFNSQLGCVSNENNVVCPTNDGYVSIDPGTGKTLWRRSMLHRPTLPIIDIYGDIIGSDGRSLVMIESDGTAQPAIQLNLPVDSIYSLNLLDNGAFLIVSTNGMVIAYLINGVPLGSMKLSGNMGGENGTFHPISSPVISGHRAYILTEFKAERNKLHLRNKESTTIVYKKLFAVDIVRSMLNIVSVPWDFTFPSQRCHSRAKMEPNIKSVVSNDSLLVAGNTIVASLSGSSSTVTCSESDVRDMLWSIEDKGKSAEMVYRIPLPQSKLSLYITNQNNFMSFNSSSSDNLLWINPIKNSGVIFGVKLENGSIISKIDLYETFGKNVSVTTNIMASRRNNKAILTFGVLNGTSVTQNWLTSYEINDRVSLITTPKWTLHVPSIQILSGQLISFISNQQNSNATRDIRIAGIGYMDDCLSLVSIK